MNLGDKTHSYDIGRTFLILIFNKCRDLSIFRFAEIKSSQWSYRFSTASQVLCRVSAYLLQEQSSLANFQKSSKYIDWVVNDNNTKQKQERKKTHSKSTIHWSVLFLSVFTYQLNQNTHVFVPEHTESSFPSSVRLGILVATSSYLVEVPRR